MLTTRVGLVDMTGTIDTQTMSATAAALNIQVTHDLPQYWSINATSPTCPTRITSHWQSVAYPLRTSSTAPPVPLIRLGSR
jgi:hypothetical protein